MLKWIVPFGEEGIGARIARRVGVLRAPGYALPLILLGSAMAAPVAIKARVGFEQNKGQFPSNVLYALRPGAYLAANARVLARDQILIKVEGGNPAAAVLPSDTLPYLVNVYSGADPRNWITGIQRFGQVEYAAVYPGIDLFFTADPFLAFRFVVGPGGDVSPIRLNIPGSPAGASAFQLFSSLAGSD